MTVTTGERPSTLTADAVTVSRTLIAATDNQRELRELLHASVTALAGSTSAHAELCARALHAHTHGPGSDHRERVIGDCALLIADGGHDNETVASALRDLLTPGQFHSWTVAQNFGWLALEHAGLTAWVAACAHVRGIGGEHWGAAAELMRAGMPLDDAIGAAALLEGP